MFGLERRAGDKQTCPERVHRESAATSVHSAYDLTATLSLELQPRLSVSIDNYCYLSVEYFEK